MLVEELSIKISADTENFTKNIYSANKALDNFRTKAMAAGREAKSAFGDIIDVSVDVPGDNGGQVVLPQAVQTIKRSTPERTVGSSAAEKTAVTEVQNYSRAFSRTANFPVLDRGETVIGAVSGGMAENERPIEITTSVELDGDSIGESVNRYLMGMSRMTNGLD